MTRRWSALFLVLPLVSACRSDPKAAAANGPHPDREEESRGTATVRAVHWRLGVLETFSAAQQLELRAGDEHFDVLCAPPMDKSYGEAWYTELDNSPSLHLRRGWSYLSGHTPRIRTERVISGVIGHGLPTQGASSPDTDPIALVQIDAENDSYDRIFFLRGDPALLPLKSVVGEHPLHFSGREVAYIQVDKRGNVTDEIPMRGWSEEVTKFYDFATAQVEKFGLPHPASPHSGK